MTPVVRVENLGKRYTIGVAQQFDTLADSLGNTLATPFRRLKSRLTRDGRKALADRADIIWALRDVSFDVEAGTVLGIIGRNGAAKSTRAASSHAGSSCWASLPSAKTKSCRRSSSPSSPQCAARRSSRSSTSPGRNCTGWRGLWGFSRTATEFSGTTCRSARARTPTASSACMSCKVQAIREFAFTRARIRNALDLLPVYFTQREIDGFLMAYVVSSKLRLEDVADPEVRRLLQRYFVVADRFSKKPEFYV